jgi:hypothetical protein
VEVFESRIGFYLSHLVTALPTTSFQSPSHYSDDSGTKLYDKKLSKLSIRRFW